MDSEMFLTEQRKKAILEDTENFAKYKSQRIGLDQYRKIVRAKLMKEAQAAGVNSVQAQEREAYASPEYEEVVNALEVATRFETELYWKLRIFDIEVQVWRTNQANKRNDI